MTFNGLYIRHFVYPIFGFGGACFAFIAARDPEAAAIPEISHFCVEFILDFIATGMQYTDKIRF